MTTDSIFQIMSMTKNFTGVAIMMLVEDGKLELRRPVSDYLPEFRNQMVEERLPNGNTSLHPPAQRPTVAQLMSHTSRASPASPMANSPIIPGACACPCRGRTLLRHAARAVRAWHPLAL